MLKLVILNVVLKVLDLASTYACINQYGTQVEANPIMKGLLESTGNYAYGITMVIFLALMALVYKKQYRGVAIVSAVIGAITVANNTIAYLL